MAFTFGIKPGSISETANPPTYEATYVATGFFDSASVLAIAGSAIPPLVATLNGLLYLQDLKVKEQGHLIYHVTANYAQNKKETGQISFRFSTTGGSFHITHS